MARRSGLVNLTLVAVTALAATRPHATASRGADGDDVAAAIVQGRQEGAAEGSSSAKPDAAPGAPGTARDHRPRRGCDLIAEYLGDSASADGARRGACAFGIAKSDGSTVVEPPMLVVLPDPIDSRLDWAFDSGIEAVRRAYERSGYLLDRFWLPWAADADTLHGARPHRDDPDSTLRAAHPGVLLFKRAPGPDSAATHRRELRLVYVISEVATGGVNQAVFDSALVDRMRVMHAAGTWPDSARPPARLARAAGLPVDARPPSAVRDSARRWLDTVRVVGPIFSGSVPSLHRRLHAWAGDTTSRLKAVVISGGATAASNKAAFDATAPWVRVVAHPPASPDTVLCAIPPDPDPALDFWATLNPVDSVLAVTRRVLRDNLGIPVEQIAVLREASTAYGAAAGGTVSGGTVSGAADAAGASVAPGRCGPRAPPPDTGMTWLEVPVPMNISRLRAELLRALAAAPALPGASAATGRAPLDLQDPATARENLPLLSRLTTPSAERTIEDIAQTLLAHRVRAVVIVATDVRDRIFLADEVRTRLRDVKVVVVGSHSLYLRPEVNEALRGTLVASTYPVFLENQFWDAVGGGGRQRFAFTGDQAEGTFNATLLQLGKDAATTDYTTPFAALGRDSVKGRRDSIALSALVPPVWLTVIGRSSLLPVRAVELGWDTAGAARPLWYVRARSRAVMGSARTTEHTEAGGLPNEASTSPVEASVLAVTLTLMVAGVFGALRVSDAAPVLGWDPPLRRPTLAGLGRGVRGMPRAVRGAPATLAGHVARALAEARAPQPVDPPAYWRHVLPPLAGHFRAWSVLRFAALFATAAPVALVLMRARIHGTMPWPFVPFAAAAASALVMFALVIEVVRVERAWRPVAVMGLALVYVLLMDVFVLDSVGPHYSAPLADPDASQRAAVATFLARALQLNSGVSPLVPLLAGGVLVLLTAAWHRNRVRQLQEVPAFEAACVAQRIGRTPLDQGAARARVPGTPEHFAASTRRVREFLHELAPTQAAGVSLVITLALALWIALHIERTPETAAVGAAFGLDVTRWPWVPSAFDLLFRLLLGAGFVIGGWTLVSFVTVWQAFRRVLQAAQLTPLDSAAGRLPKLIPGSSRLSPFGGPDRDTLHAMVTAEISTRVDEIPAFDVPPLVVRARDAAAPMGERVEAAGEQVGALYRNAFTPDDPGPDAPPLVRPVSLRARPGAVREEIVALYFVDYVEWVIRHLRRLAFGLLAGLALTTVLLSSYPFEPQSLVKATFFVLMAASVGAVLAVLVQMNRDPVLSAITHTDPGEVTWDAPFVLNLVLVGAVPALTLLGTQFPEVRDFLFSWVTPILRTVGRN